MIEQQPKRGRPKTGNNPQINSRIPRAMMARVDAFAAREFITRANAIRALVEGGLMLATLDKRGGHAERAR